MKNPEWGAMFFDEAVNSGAKMYWGARGAIRYCPAAPWNGNKSSRELQLYPDRQSFVADDESNKSDFVSFLNDELIPQLEQHVKKCDTRHVEVNSADGRFRAAAEDRNSGGYFYIGAWSL